VIEAVERVTEAADLAAVVTTTSTTTTSNSSSLGDGAGVVDGRLKPLQLVMAPVWVCLYNHLRGLLLTFTTSTVSSQAFP